jgi:superfamily II DNA or RNA helicase
LDQLAGLLPIDELLVLGGQPDVRDAVSQMRIQEPGAAPLPAGLYWFAPGESSARVMAVFGDLSPASAHVVRTDELDPGHPLSAADGWMKALWASAAAIPRPRFRAGDDVVVTSSGKDFPVRRRRLAGAKWIYELRADGRTQAYSDDMLAPLIVGDDPLEWVDAGPDSARRFSATLSRAKLAGAFTDTIFSFRASRTIFRGYQFKPVIRMLETGISRILVADEVGLGKTIEGGLIWTELEARSAADRVLVVCPASLIAKWRREMEDRFGLILTELSGPTLTEFAERAGENRLPRRFSYVISMQRLRTWTDLKDIADLAGPLSLVIVDEAHMMRNSDTRSYDVGEVLSTWAEAMVLLTATPINLRNQDLRNQLELLTPGEFGDDVTFETQVQPNQVLNRLSASLTHGDASGEQRASIMDELQGLAFGQHLLLKPEHRLLRELISRDQLTAREVVEAKRYIADLNVLSGVLTRTRRVDVDEKKALREPVDVEVQWTSAEEDFYQEYVAWCQARADLSGAHIEFAMQMPLRLASACLPMARRDVLRWAERTEILDEDAPDSTAKAPALKPHRELVEAAQRLGEADTKFSALEGKLLELIRTGHQGLLFTFSRPTLNYLKGRLASHCRVAVLHGGVPRRKRQEIITAFRKGAYDLVLANRVASEGLDFEFCSFVVNYDLPWNPMEVEQRIGRIDRIGQEAEKIAILNVWCPAALDEKMKHRLLQRIGVFERTIGALEPIIDTHLRDLRSLVFDFSLSERERVLKADQVMAAVEAQRIGLEELESASPYLIGTGSADVAGMEQDILTSGRYVGGTELARLVEDWAHVADAEGITGDLTKTIRLRGNRAMADAMQQLVASGRLRANEVAPYRQALMDETEIHLALDHEFARTLTSAELLTARHPLILGATLVPEQRASRYAVLRVEAPPESAVLDGWYAVILGIASWGSIRPGREIWGCPVDSSGISTDQAVVDLLLSALARGELQDAAQHAPLNLPDLVQAARSAMDLRMLDEAMKRTSDALAIIANRRAVLEEQHTRRVAAIRQRQATAEQGRRNRGVELFQWQLKHAEEGHRRTLEQLEQLGTPDVSVTYLAVCAVQVSHGR